MHIAIIMDGNGRWANRRGLPRHEGHQAGAVRVREIAEECARRNIEQLTLYCFSSENWKRPKLELDFLMNLFREYLGKNRDSLMDNGIRVSVIGRRTSIAEDILAAIDELETLTQHNKGLRLCLAVNYGSHGEIVDAVKKIVDAKIPSEQIDEQCIADHLYTAGMSDPDLLIRTAGELRLSNYLLWQLSYAEIWVTEKCWPDFDVALFDQALQDFAQRQRKFGGL
ncbi:MAG: polyprenyl diphosphate synthase [Planctomycetaceae bacterium]|nr:polyprenyl diphosphate synthase [Planctomycetaceae bacterium]